MAKLRFGIVGVSRGSVFISALRASGAEVVAYCESNPKKRENLLKYHPDLKEIPIFDDYDEFIEYDMDAVILANYFSEHAPFAIKAMKKGKHVLSETISNVTMAQGVELCRCVEETGKIYGLLENYPYFKQNLAMEKLYKSASP